MGQETYLRVGIDGTAAQTGSRVVTRSLDDISNSARTVNTHVEYLQSALTHLAGTAVGVYGIATALQAVKNVSISVLDYLGKIETATLGIASAFLVSGQYQDTMTRKVLQGQAALKAAQGESAAVIEQLKVANFQTIATLDQLIFAYQVTLPVAMSAGFNKKQVMDYTLAMVQAAGAIGLAFDQIAEETRSMLTGNITRNSRIAQVLGLTNSDVSTLKGNASGLFDMLMGRLSGFRLAGIEAQKTWAGLLSNTKDIALQFSGKAFDSVFETIKAKLIEVQKTMFTITKDSNGIQSIKFNPEFDKQLNKVSSLLKQFTDILISSATFLYQHAGAIKDVVEIYIGFRLTIMAASAAQKAANVVSMESWAIENGRRAMAMESLNLTAQQTQAVAANAAAEVSRHAALKNSLTAAIEAQSFNVNNLAYQKEAAVADVEQIAAEKAKLAARKASLQQHLEVIATETAALEEKYGVSKAVLAKEIASTETAAATMKQTWREFTSERMSDYMRMEGGHAAAMKRMSVEWKEYKASAISEINQVASAAIASTATLGTSSMSKGDSGFAKELRNSEWKTRNELVSIMNEEEAASARLQAAKAKEITLSEQLRNAKYRLNSTSSELMQTQSVLTASTKVQQATQLTAMAAAEKHTAALAAQSIGARITAGSVSALNSAMTYLGGPIGTIITLLGAAATAWFVFGREAKKANDDALKGADDVLANLRKQNTELKERKRLASVSKEEAQNNPSSAFSDKELEELKNLETRKNELQRSLFQAVNKSGDFDVKEIDTRKITASAQSTVSALKMSISQITTQINEMKRLKAENKAMEAETEYKPNAPKVEVDKLGTVRKFYDSVTAATKSYEAWLIAGHKEAAKAELAILEEKHKLGLSATQEYLTKKASVEKASLQQEIDANLKTIAEIENSPAYKNTSEDLKALTAQNEQITKRNNLLTKNVELEKHQAAIGVQTNVEIAASVVDLISKQEELNIKVLQAKGREAEASKAQLDTVKTRLELTAMETEKASAEASGDLDRIARATSTLNLKREEIGVMRQLIDLAEQRKQAESIINVRNAAGDHAGALKLAQALERQEEAFKGLSKEAKSANEALRQYNLAKAKIEQGKELEELQINSITDPNMRAMEAEQKRHENYVKNKELELALVEHNSDREKQIIAEMEQEAANHSDTTYKLRMESASQYVGMAGQLFTALASTEDESSRKGFEAAKAFNLAAVVMNTASAVMAQLSIPGPAGWAAASLTAVMGAIQFAKIASTSYGGGSASPTNIGGFGGGGISEGGRVVEDHTSSEGVGSSIGSQIFMMQSQQTESSLRRLADASENASLAISKITEGFTNIEDLFKTGYSKNLSRSLGTRGLAEQSGVFGQTWSDAKSGGLSNFFMTGAGVSMLKHAFGIGNKWYTKDQGIALALAGGETRGVTYTTQQKDGGWFTHDKKKTSYGAIDSEKMDVLKDYTDQIKSQISRAAVSLGTSTDFSKAGVVQRIFSTAGKSQEDIQKQLEGFFTDVSGSLAKTTEGLSEFTFAGENAFDALMRLSTSLQSVNEMFEKTGHSLIESTLAGADVAYRLSEAFGGIEKMSEAIDEYFKGMFTEAEQDAMTAAQKRRQINTAFGEMGLAVPSTVAEFRALVDSMDVMTKEGASMYASLIAIAPTFADVAKQAEEMANKIAASFANLTSRALKANDQSAMADIYDLMVSQQDELNSYIDQGLDTTQLRIVQRQELLAALQDGYDAASDAYYEAIVNGANELMDAAKSTKAAFESIRDAVTSTLQQMRVGDASILSPEQRLAEARQNLETAYQQGMLGDQDALSNLSALSQTYLQLAQEYYASGQGYVAVYGSVEEMLTHAQDYSQQQIDAATQMVEQQKALLAAIHQSEEERKAQAQQQIDELKAQNQLLMTGFQRMIDIAENQADSLEDIQAKIRLAAAGE